VRVCFKLNNNEVPDGDEKLNVQLRSYSKVGCRRGEGVEVEVIANALSRRRNCQAQSHGTKDTNSVKCQYGVCTVHDETAALP